MHHLNSRRSGSNACRASSSAPSRRRLWTRSGTSRLSTTGPGSARRWAISARRSSRRPIGLRKIHAQRRRKGRRWLRGRFRFRWLRLRGPRSSGCAAAKARARAACACGWLAWTVAATGSAVADGCAAGRSDTSAFGWGRPQYRQFVRAFDLGKCELVLRGYSGMSRLNADVSMVWRDGWRGRRIWGPSGPSIGFRSVPKRASIVPRWT